MSVLTNSQPEPSTSESEPSSSSGSDRDPGSSTESAWVEVFFDGACPMCAWEMAFLVKRDRHRRIQFTNIAHPEFDALAETGRSAETLDARIHGRILPGCPSVYREKAQDVSPEGIIEGVEVFRQLYGAIGWHRRVAITRWPLVRGVLHLGYRLFARYRTRVGGWFSFLSPGSTSNEGCPDGQCSVDVSRTPSKKS